jgi:hypothetical protein
MSETLDLFKAALGLGEPWRVTRSDFDVAQGLAGFVPGFPAGGAFRVCGDDAHRSSPGVLIESPHLVDEVPHLIRTGAQSRIGVTEWSG